MLTSDAPDNKQVVGMIGVYFMAWELSRRGYVAVPTVRNVKSSDLLVTNLDGTRAVTLQVKTRKGTDFPVASFPEEPTDYDAGSQWLEAQVSVSPTRFFSFVQIDEDGSTVNYWVMPSEEVLKEVKRVRDEYLGGRYSNKPKRLATRGKNIGKPIRDQGTWPIEPPTAYRNGLGIIETALRTT